MCDALDSSRWLGRLRGAAAFGALALSIGAQTDRRASQLQVPRGGTARHTLIGAQYDPLTAVQIVQGPRRTSASDVRAMLGTARRGTRTLTIEAGARAALGADYQLQGLVGNRVVMTLPLQLNVVAERDEPASSAVTLDFGTERSLELSGDRYAAITEARVLRDGRVTSELTARVDKTGSASSLVLSAARATAAADYQVQVKIDGRWQTLPLQLATRAGQAVRARPRVETITMPDGTVVRLGPSQRPAGGEVVYDPKPRVESWQPAHAVEVGGTITVAGYALPQGVTVRIGDTTLATVSHAQDKVVVKAPAASADCPPGALAVYDASGSRLRTCREHYFVKGDKPFHHFATGSNGHEWINSYLLALASLHIYSDGGGETWQQFQQKFANKLRDLGMNEFAFAAETTPNMDTEVAIAANPEVIVIVLRGSEGPGNQGILQDWVLTDFNLLKKPVNSWKNGAWVHTGFYNAWDAVHQDVRNKLGALRNNDQKVFVCGHSLGGAVASMGAFRLSRAGIPIQGVYTYASPRVGNQQWAEAYGAAGLQSRTQRWCNKRDIVPRYPGMPSIGWQHVGRTNNIYEDHTIKLDDDEIMLALKWTFLHHDMLDYIGEIHDDLPAAMKQLVPPKPN